MAQISKEYALALFQLSKEDSRTDDYNNALDLVFDVIDTNPDYILFLTSPNIATSEKLTALKEAFGESIPEEILSFLCILCKKGHAAYIKDCILEFRACCDEESKVSTAVVKTAYELNESQKTKLIQKLEKISGNKVLLDIILDKTLIGGLSINLDGQIIDGTLKHKLHEVKDVIAK